MLDSSKDKLFNVLRKYFGANEGTLYEWEKQNSYDNVADSGFLKTSMKMIRNKTSVTKDIFDAPYCVVHENVLGASATMILIRTKYASLVSKIESKTLKLGLLNQVANKGALSISFLCNR